jgi:hypothetical protein
MKRIILLTRYRQNAPCKKSGNAYKRKEKGKKYIETNIGKILRTGARFPHFANETGGVQRIARLRS